MTAELPYPMELEMEKVYHPCVLCAKKRYVGYMYESESGPPKLDAKGIETIRRDGCPAERKVPCACTPRHSPSLAVTRRLLPLQLGRQPEEIAACSSSACLPLTLI